MKGNKKDLLFGIVAVVAVFVVHTLMCLGLRGVLPFQKGDLIPAYFVSELLFAACAIIALLVLKKQSVLKFKTEGIGQGLEAGAYFLLVIGLLSLGFLGQVCVLGTGLITVGAFRVVLFILYAFLIGFAEEVLFRGIIQNACHKLFGEDSYGHIVAGIVLSGVIFGMIHLSNALSGVNIVSAIIQAVAVIPIGIILGAVYYRSNRNIWLVILFHGVFDGLQFAVSGILSGTDVNSMLNSYSGSIPVKMIGLAVCLGFAALALRKKKIKVHQEIQTKEVAFA